MALIEVDELHYRYADGTIALSSVSFRIEPGERVALLGPNGAGKSTLLFHLNGIFLPQRGRVSILGVEVTPKTERWVRQKVGLVFQDPDDQVFSSTVWDDVCFGPFNMGLDREEVFARAREALATVGLTGLEHKSPQRLSYGQKKRAAIAGVLAMSPAILVFDEPTASLDPKGRAMMLETLWKLHEEGKSVIVATHDVDLASEWADRVLIMREGSVCADGGGELLWDRLLMEKADLCVPSKYSGRVEKCTFLTDYLT